MVKDISCIKILKDHDTNIWRAAISPDRKKLVTLGLSMSQPICIWDMESQQLLNSFEYGNVRRSVAFSPDGTRIVTGSQWGGIDIWDVDTGKPLRVQWDVASDSIESVAYSPDGKRIAIGDGDKIGIVGK